MAQTKQPKDRSAGTIAGLISEPGELMLDLGGQSSQPLLADRITRRCQQPAHLLKATLQFGSIVALLVVHDRRSRQIRRGSRYFVQCSGGFSR
jgi:hypothetical protein